MFVDIRVLVLMLFEVGSLLVLVVPMVFSVESVLASGRCFDLATCF